MNSSNILYSLGSLANPSSLQEMYLAIEAEKKRKNELAKKVIAAKGLTKEEKQEIFSLLTDDELSFGKKGRPSKNERDKAFAFDYLEAKYIDKYKWTGIENVAIKHKININDHTTIYKALKRGLKALEEESKDAEYAINYGPEEMTERLLNNPKYVKFKAMTLYILSLIKTHKLSKELDNMTGKKASPINSLE